MRSRLALHGVTLLLAFPLAAQRATRPPIPAATAPATMGPEPRLLIPGAAFDGEDAAVAGRQWFGVYLGADSGLVLRPTRVTIERGEFACSQSKVVASDAVQPLFLVSSVSSFRAGPVTTIFNGYRFLYPGESVSWQLAGGWFVLQAEGTATKVPYGTTFTGYQLKLGSTRDRYTTSQLLARLDFGDERPTIHWAGDLDGDGRLDLLLTLPTGGYSKRFHLFLSSVAHGSDHLGEAGEFGITDC